ncbi:unnamed protein product [Protopolystoma xenopodis]|uniref:Uncharacterized protein n=1 Tax=Protopolystoma xenopodis TaxID=117903 RepID=A0A3S5AH49_9PLAT|nr:unnamed protein product [Protopolystoma xenopodis]
MVPGNFMLVIAIVTRLILPWLLNWSQTVSRLWVGMQNAECVWKLLN